jgi:WD40 repeat protein
MKRRNKPTIGYQYFVLILAVFAFSGMGANEVLSQRSSALKPLMVIRDANRPSLSFDGNILAAGSEIGLSEIYDVGKNRQIAKLKVDDSESQAVSGDGRFVGIFSGGDYVKYDVALEKLLPKARAWTLKNGKEFVSVGISNQGGMTSRTISSDLDIAVNIHPWWREPIREQPALVVGRLSDQSVIAELHGTDGFIRGDIWQEEAISPNAKIVAASRYNNNDRSRGVTLVWDVASKKIILRLPFASHWLSLADDRSRLVTKESGDGKDIQVWDLATGKRVSTIDTSVGGRPVLVSAGVISPDGRLLVTTRNVDFYFWDTTTGKYVTSVKQDHISEGNVKSAVFSGDGKRIAIGSDTEIITVWSVEEILKHGKKERDMPSRLATSQ